MQIKIKINVISYKMSKFSYTANAIEKTLIRNKNGLNNSEHHSAISCDVYAWKLSQFIGIYF